jgi:hypothetical protein
MREVSKLKSQKYSKVVSRPCDMRACLFTYVYIYKSKLHSKTYIEIVSHPCNVYACMCICVYIYKSKVHSKTYNEIVSHPCDVYACMCICVYICKPKLHSKQNTAKCLTPRPGIYACMYPWIYVSTHVGLFQHMLGWMHMYTRVYKHIHAYHIQETTAKCLILL